MLVPVILSGGAGTRLWPRSRQHHPKQFLPLLHETTMFEETLARTEDLPQVSAPLVVCNVEHRTFVQMQLRSKGRIALGVLLEPVGRNTAPAVAVAAEHARATLGGDPLLLVLPSDHLVRDPAAFREAVEAGIPRALAGELVTFGVVPDRPETGYGYIHAASRDGPAAVRSFTEKPDLATAQAYLASGEHYWNSGMFLLRASTYLQELARHRPDMVGPCRLALQNARLEQGAVLLDAEAFARCPSDSIDYAVMERTDRAAVVPMAAGWSDVGSWHAVWEASAKDEAGNSKLGDVLAIDAEGCHLDAQRGTLAAIGVRDLVVVTTEDAVLVVPRERAQDVKLAFERLREGRNPAADDHPERLYAWGRERVVAPGVVRLSMQSGASVVRRLDAAMRVVVVTKGSLCLEHAGITQTLESGKTARLVGGAPYRIVNIAGTDATAYEIDAV